MGVGGLTFFIFSSLVLYFLVGFIKLIYKLWWKPIQIQKFMGSQGVKGPSYKFLHGNTKEALNMTKEAMKDPMELTNDILPRVQPNIHIWMQLYGKNHLSWYGCKAQFVVTEPDLIKEVMNNKNGVYSKIEQNEYVKKMLGDGLVTVEGKKWSRQRKLANHAFHVENLKGMVPTIVTSVEEMLKRWGNHETKEIEVVKEYIMLTSDVISKTAFGSNYQEGQDIFNMLTKLGSIIAGNFNKVQIPVIGKFLMSSDDHEADKLEHGMRESFIDLIRQRKEKMCMGDIEGYGSDYLGLLLKANQDINENTRISVDDMIDECKTFYLAGQETTMSLLTWSTLLLAVHTDWQEKARKEVFDLFGKKHPNTDDNNISKMKTMTMIINETLRLYPPALTILRKVTCQVQLGEIVLPPNMEIVIPLLVSHNDPHIWGENAHLFKPDRFAEGVTGAAQNTSAYLPFGMGPRICVGSNFAAIEVKIALCMILQRYAFTLSSSYVHSPIQHLTTRPQYGVQINLHPL
ncbi:hypothetical protein ACHQM5_008874 [Ranunculus cassubicifolius]